MGCNEICTELGIIPVQTILKGKAIGENGETMRKSDGLRM